MKSENDHLREQLEDSELRLMKLQPKPAIDENSKVSEKNSSENEGGDIATILKLSNKLQEMIDVNESITQVNTSLRKVKLSIWETCSLSWARFCNQHFLPMKYSVNCQVSQVILTEME